MHGSNVPEDATKSPQTRTHLKRGRTPTIRRSFAQRALSPLAVIAAFALTVAGLGAVQLSPQAVTPAEAVTTLGTFSAPNVNGWRNVGAAGAGTSLGISATQGGSTRIPFAPIDRDHLYGSQGYSMGGQGQFWYWPEPIVANQRTMIGYGIGTSAIQSVPGSTIAVDADPYGDRGVKSIYAWGWNDEGNVTQAENGGVTVPANSVGIIRWQENDPNGKFILVPGTYSFSDYANVWPGWSGGEVIQQTGEIFFGGGECSNINNHYRMMIFNPQTYQYVYSGRLMPKTSADNIFGTTDGCPVQNGYVASDFALDANGNAYLQVMGTGGTMYMVRVVPDRTAGGTWYYNVLGRFRAAPGQGSAATNYANTGIAEKYLYGSAFFNGYLYVTMYGSSNGTLGNVLVRIDPMSNMVYSLGVGLSGATGNGYIQDLASGQTAQVVQGTVYNDANANGSIESGEVGVPDVTVAAYGKNTSGQYVFRGYKTTDASGDYAFLLAGDGDYIFRVVQPQINGVNAVQTWADGAVKTAPNSSVSITAKCIGGDVTAEAGGVCEGAKAMPAPDPALPDDSAIGTSTATQPADMPIYTMVSIRGDELVGDADFGITTQASYGDAAAGPSSLTTAPYAPVHVNGVTKQVWLGSELGKNSLNTAQGHSATDDGVFINSVEGAIPLQDNTLAATRSYNLASTVSGPSASSAQIKGWVTGVGNNNWNTTARWTPTVSGDTATGSFKYQDSGTVPANSNGQLRAQVSTATINAPTNTAGEYQALNGSSTQNWATPGEIEDYAFKLHDAVYRPAAVTTGGEGNFTPV